MSPTSYQTAPPRISIIQTCEHPVKRLNLAAAVSELGHHWHSRTPVGMQARAVSQGPMLTGLLVGEAVAERESDGGVRDVVVCFGGARFGGKQTASWCGARGDAPAKPREDDTAARRSAPHACRDAGNEYDRAAQWLAPTG